MIVNQSYTPSLSLLAALVCVCVVSDPALAISTFASVLRVLFFFCRYIFARASLQHTLYGETRFSFLFQCIQYIGVILGGKVLVPSNGVQCELHRNPRFPMKIDRPLGGTHAPLFFFSRVSHCGLLERYPRLRSSSDSFQSLSICTFIRPSVLYISALDRGWSRPSFHALFLFA